MPAVAANSIVTPAVVATMSSRPMSPFTPTLDKRVSVSCLGFMGFMGLIGLIELIGFIGLMLYGLGVFRVLELQEEVFDRLRTQGLCGGTQFSQVERGTLVPKAGEISRGSCRNMGVGPVAPVVA